MRIFAAYGLLCLFLAGWAGGYWRCSEATYTLRLQHRMNAREAAVAQHLAEQLSEGQLVKMTTAADAPIRGHFYSNQGFYSLEMGGDTLHFFLLDESKALDYEAGYEKPQNSSGEETPIVHLNDFFKDYLYPELTISLSYSPELPALGKVAAEMYSSPFQNVPEPPPDPFS